MTSTFPRHPSGVLVAGRRIPELRNRRGLSQAALADLIGVRSETISRWERTESTRLRPSNAGALAAALAVPLEALTMGDEAYSISGHAPLAGGIITIPALADYITSSDLESIAGLARRLIEVENRTGGKPVLGSALQLLNAMRARLDRGAIDPEIMGDAVSVAAELAEIAGFFAWDTDQLDLARSFNLEALHLARLVDDRAIELLTLQNMSMAAVTANMPAESLLIASRVLESSGSMSERVRATFTIRKARAQAMAGDWAAMKTYQEAHQQWSYGVSDTDPQWCWWLDVREMAWQKAMIDRDLGNRDSALENCQKTLEATRPHETKKLFAHRIDLLRAQAEVGAWSELHETISLVLPLDTVQSERAIVTLHEAARAAPEQLASVTAALAELSSGSP